VAGVLYLQHAYECLGEASVNTWIENPYVKYVTGETDFQTEAPMDSSSFTRWRKRIDIQVRRIPGTALANQTTGEVIYTPPFGEDLLRTKLANRERYLHEQRDTDPLMERLRQYEHWRACVWP
jgi:hypothetical protein